LSFEEVKYAALDSRLGFEIARKCFQLAWYNTRVDHPNVGPIEISSIMLYTKLYILNLVKNEWLYSS
jgi:hypothetical protein